MDILFEGVDLDEEIKVTLRNVDLSGKDYERVDTLRNIYDSSDPTNLRGWLIETFEASNRGLYSDVYDDYTLRSDDGE